MSDTTNPMILEKYSVGVGDRFAHQAKAQLRASMRAVAEGVDVIPVWNKSNREHNIVGSEPASVRQAAEAAALREHARGRARDELWEAAFDAVSQEFTLRAPIEGEVAL